MLKKFDGVEIIITTIQNIHKHAQLHGGNTIGTTCVVDRDDTVYMVVDREFRLPTE